MENGATAQFERALTLYQGGSEQLAYQAAKVVLDRAPEHVGGMMLLLIAAAAIGDEVTISDALREVAPRFRRLVAIPEARELFEDDVLEPVVTSRTFRTVFAPALRSVEQGSAGAAERMMARQVQEAIQAGSVARLLEATPAFRPALAQPKRRMLHLVEQASGTVLAEISEGELCLVGRSADADVHLNHASVSREHLQVSIHAGRWYVQNRSQTNGTILNGQVVGDGWTNVQEGDELRLGDVTLDVLAPGHGYRLRPAAAPAPDADQPITSHLKRCDEITSPPAPYRPDVTTPSKVLKGGNQSLA